MQDVNIRSSSVKSYRIFQSIHESVSRKLTAWFVTHFFFFRFIPREDHSKDFPSAFAIKKHISRSLERCGDCWP